MDIDWKALFLSPQGRIKRQSFWIGWLFTIIVYSILAFAVKSVNQILPTLVFLVFCYPWVCVYSKRFHDLGKSGWLTAIPVGVSIASSLFMVSVLMRNPEIAAMVRNPFAVMGDPEAAQRLAKVLMPASIVGNIGNVINLGFLLWLGIANSQEGPNKYGPEPGTEDEDVF